MQYTNKLGLKKPELTDYVNVNDLNENMDILDQEIANITDEETGVEAKLTQHLDDYANVKSKAYEDYNFSVTSYDEKGKPTQTQYKRPNNTLYLQVDASNADTNGNYQTVTEKYYDINGTTLLKTVTWTITFNADGVITARNWAVV